MDEIPEVIELLYDAWIGRPDPARWPEGWDPVRAASMDAFYQGLSLGFQLFSACG